MALAAACRLAVRLIPDAAIGATLSAPLPGPEGHILFPPCDRPLESMNASALLVIARDGQIVAGQGGADMGAADTAGAEMGEADREAAAFHAALDGAAAGRRLAALLGERHILMSASAGLFVAEETIRGAVHQLYNLERAARIQVLAMSTGRATRSIRPGVPGYDEGRSDRRRFQAEQHFAALMRVLDREDASYRD